MKFSAIRNRISIIKFRIFYRRKTRLYCVGAAKTGTHSIDSMFDESVRSAHEPDSEGVIDKIFEIVDNKIQENEIVSYLRKRDKRLCLDVDSSQLNYFLMDYLLLMPRLPSVLGLGGV